MNLAPLKKLILTAICAVSTLLATQAADEAKPDPTGTWTWSIQTQNGETRETTLKLKREGDKITGTMTGRNGTETEIQEGKIDKDQVSFQITREREGNKMVSKYTGKLSGDKITGKSESPNRDGEVRSRDWEAKRQGGSKSNISGVYKYQMKVSDDMTLEPVLTLKQDGDKITGSVMVNDSDAAITDVKYADKTISFKTTRERDGQKFTSSYNGKIEGDSITGKIESKWGDDLRNFDWEAKKSKE